MTRQLKKAAEFKSIASTPSSLHIDEFGMLMKTGFSLNKLEFAIDIYNATAKHAQELKQINPNRAKRFIRWTEGQPIRTFWYMHRSQLAQDVDQFIKTLKAGGYE